MEYWIDGHFVRFWNRDSVWYCPERDLFVPKFATIDKEDNRIYITSKYAESKIWAIKNKILRNDNVNDMRLIAFVKALNKPWKREYTEPPFEVSLP